MKARKEEKNQHTMMSQESTKKGIIVPKPEFLLFSVIIQSGCTPKQILGLSLFTKSKIRLTAIT
jgi:hypothetical protein